MNFGCYCLFRLGLDLCTFNNYPIEIKKLEQVNGCICRIEISH